MTSKGFPRIFLVLSIVCLTLFLVSTMFAQTKQAPPEAEQAVVAAAAAAGTEINVTTEDDELNSDGDCSLREAVEASNTDTAVDNCPAGDGWDIISIPIGFYQITIAGSDEDGNSTGDLDLLDSVTINGSGSEAAVAKPDDSNGLAPTATILDGGDLDRVFHIDPTELGVSVTINDLVVRNGSAVEGGGLLQTNGNILLKTVAFYENEADYGGAVSINYGTLEIVDSTFSFNMATADCAGKPTACDSTANGGGIYSYTGVVTIKDTQISNNSADYGGGIYNDYGSLTVANSQLLWNSVGTDGGGIYSNYGNLIVEANSEIAFFCDAEATSGIYTDDDTTAMIVDSWVHDNTGTAYGGGWYMYGYGGLIDNSTFENNTTDGYGGGVYAYGDLIVENSDFSHNGSDYGGGIYQYDYSLAITNTTLYSNTAQSDGGGIFLESGASMVMRDSVMRENWSDGDGGGFYLYNESGAIVEDSAFIDNVSGEGGAIMVYEDATLNVERSTFSGNQATSDGGAIYLYDYAPADIRNSTFSENHADGDGGALYVYYPSAVIENGTIVNNSADGSGGGIYSDDYGHIQNSIVAGNQAGGSTTAADADCYFHSELYSGGNNIFGDGTGCDATRYDEVIDPADVFVSLLGSLADNNGRPLPDGSYLQIHALLSGSAAIDAAYSFACPAEDQRGVARDQGNGCDIGAYESSFSATVSTATDHLITVDTVVDDAVNNGNCTLQEAIEAANTDTAVDGCTAGDGWDTISLPAGTYVLNDTGSLTSTQSLTIQGADVATTIIDGNDMDVRMIENYQSTLVLRDVTVTNGRFTTAGYGCIYNNEGFLILEESAITHCEMNEGGAIYNEYGVVRLLSSTLSGNMAKDGGGIYNYYGTISLAESTLRENSATGSFVDGSGIHFYGDGGGIYSEGSAQRIENSQVISNTAVDEAGGVYLEYGSLLIDNSQFNYNEADYDGAIQVYYGATAIDDSTFTYNSASTDHGAIYIYYGGWLRNGEVAYNTSNNEAGALDGGSLLQNVDIHHNEAANYAGGTNFWGVMENSTIRNNRTTASDGEGGGIYGEGVIFINSTVSNNEAAYGGGIYNDSYGGVISINSTFSDNDATYDGGGVYAYGESFTARRSTFDGNTAGSTGGAIYSDDTAIDLLNSTVSGNSAISGGGIFATSSTLSLNFSTVADNGVEGSTVGKERPTPYHFNAGGGFYSTYATTVQNSIVASNKVNSTLVADSADCYAEAPITFAGYTVFGDGTGCDTAVTSDTLVNPATVFTTLIKPLADNSGGTLTHALYSGSPAINNANPEICISRDQRMVRRPLTACDSGAFEFSQILLPIIDNNYKPLPDLIVENLTVTNNEVTVVIVNQGTAAVTGDFWVDVYINPSSAPTAPNQTWTNLGGQGIVWGITSRILNPGDTLTLTLDSGYYDKSESNFSGNIPAGAQVYAQVDSANVRSGNGAILESHEAYGGSYNNIIGPVLP